MKVSQFPAFVRALPEADLPFVGLRGWLLQSESGQVLFNESDSFRLAGRRRTAW
jgi:hypothetical protein